MKLSENENEKTSNKRLFCVHMYAQGKQAKDCLDAICPFLSQKSTVRRTNMLKENKIW